MADPTRRLKDPILNEDGSFQTRSLLTPVSFTTRGVAYVGSRKVVPVIFVPGIMGTNLRVRTDAVLPSGYPLQPGEPAWRPPNGTVQGLLQAKSWNQRLPRDRQLILNPNYLEVDDTGDLDIAPCFLERSVMRERGWAAVHNGSYGTLLFELQSYLEMTFRIDELGERHIRQRWVEVMKAMQGNPLQRWGVRTVEPLTEGELERYAEFQYPVYACGYNWLQSASESAKRLEIRIKEIITWWLNRKHQCFKVILVTHSTGGLVARACAKANPELIAGVVHGAMPALGAPLAYRRIACGTESDSPTNDIIDDYKAGKFASIAGQSPEESTPVLSVSAGALELLPNQLYPRPWLHAQVTRQPGRDGSKPAAQDFVRLPDESEPNPYKLYRDMESWYRLINPTLADPARLYDIGRGGVKREILLALAEAEKFHYNLADYYHPATFAFYGYDREQLSYGQIVWKAEASAGLQGLPLTSANIRNARYLVHEPDGARTVEVEGKFVLTFSVAPQESFGDGTVPYQSGVGTDNKVKQLFATHGYRHQASFLVYDTLLLTRYCIVKLVQGLAT